MFVFDATPLIVLAKTEHLETVVTAAGECLIPDRVYEEVVEIGLREGHADARRIERAVEAGYFERAAVSDDETFARFSRNSKLSDADAAVLAMASERDSTAILDDQYGRDVAAAEGIPTRGTAFLVLHALREEAITEETARATIEAMVEAGWYLSPALYSKILKRIEDLA